MQAYEVFNKLLNLNEMFIYVQRTQLLQHHARMAVGDDPLSHKMPPTENF